MTRTDDEPPEWAKERAREMMAAEEDAEANGPADADDPADAAEAPERDDERVPDVPAEAVDEAERLTRLAREAESAEPTPEIEQAADQYRERRDALAAEYGYTARVRDEDDALVLYPDEWMEEGTVQLDRVEDTDRAVEVSLSGPGDADRYREVAAYNEAVAEAVAEREADVHARTAETFAAFMSNHYVRPVDDATPKMRAEFREEYLVRNGWPTDEQLAVADESLSVIESVAADVDESVAVEALDDRESADDDGST
ncbi:DUF7108 domain-containing protein [Halorubrum distributum]|uniref:RnhA operon protein n=2 Tax=Halorubrum distributum TaxID=29283 RepID=M0NUL2_9EURY|nr:MULTISPECIES: hypothetical protein [Halorubrum distributum group]EMA61253.1 hypothetical protein C470_06994 [Halorubrum litoreum JCM 13561]MYL17973.1 hypothetical protein [Halorubrum terrestre]MYL69069.1 hypothetical protein [Halorubrum terrestre]